MAEREGRRHHHRRRSSNKKKKENPKVEDKGKVKDGPHVKLCPVVDEVAISCELPPSEDTVITLTKSEERYRKFMDDSDDAKLEKLARKKGWCFSDGVPWGANQMPKDEAALLKKGVVDPHCSRLTYCAADSAGLSSMGEQRFYDEIELYKNGLSSKKGRTGVALSPGSLEPINIAELNSRGFVDQNGQIHFRLPELAPLKDKKKSKRSKKYKEARPRVTYQGSHESISIMKTPPESDQFEPNSSETRVSFSPSRDYTFSESSTKKKKNIKKAKNLTPVPIPISPSCPNLSGTIRCEAGNDDDRAIINYTVSSDGRNYELQTNDGHYLHLEFNKKHAYLIVD